MQAQPSVALPTGDYSARVGSVGWLAVLGNPVAVLGLLMVDYQSGGHAEMGSFDRGNMIWFLAFGLWGFGTGLGLLRAYAPGAGRVFRRLSFVGFLQLTASWNRGLFDYAGG